MHKSLYAQALQYLADDVQLVADSGRRLLRSASDRTCVVHGHITVSATAAFLPPDPECGTLYLKNSDRTQASDSLGANWNRICLSRLLNHGELWQIVSLRLINILTYLLTYLLTVYWFSSFILCNCCYIPVLCRLQPIQMLLPHKANVLRTALMCRLFSFQLCCLVNSKYLILTNWMGECDYDTHLFILSATLLNTTLIWHVSACHMNAI